MRNLLLLLLAGTVLCSFAEEKKRPDKWAKKIDTAGLPNLHKVSDKLFRSAQPSNQGMKNAEKLHKVAVVVNLRSFSSDRDELKGTSMKYEHIFMKAWHAEEKEVIRFIKIVNNSKGPVLVHCKHGADRTGTMCAIYRIVFQGWTKEEAIKEMKDGGYGHHKIFKNLPRFIMKLDVGKVKKAAGITK